MTDLTTNERKFIQLFRDSDEAGKNYIIQVLICSSLFGADFYAEMEELKDRGDKDGMKECAARWYARGCEEFGAERMTL